MTYLEENLPIVLCIGLPITFLGGHVRVLIAFCIAVLLVSPLGAQEPTQGALDSTTSRPERPYRNPHRALVLGTLIPGAGHIYAGEYVTGILTYEATVGAIGGGTLVFLFDKCIFTFLSSSTCKPGPEWPHQLLGVTIVGMGIWKWISSARDAPSAAERANTRHRGQTSALTPYIAPFSGPADATDVGVSIRW
jgi:hypothetical protein